MYTRKIFGYGLIAVLFALAFSALSLTSCEQATDSSTGSTVSVTGVTLDQGDFDLPVGFDITLTATVAPNNATNRAVTWTSDDEDIATVENGVVTAVAVGEATITVTTVDGGYTDECTVTVKAVPESIEVTQEPTKTTYKIGEPLDLTGIVVTATYSDDTEEVTITEANITGFDSSTVGEKTLTVTYGGKTDTFTVTVIELSSIAVTTPPNKTTYSIGEALNLTGLVVTATYSDDSTEEVTITAANITGFSSTTEGQKTLTVTYGGKTTSFNITVTAASGSNITWTLSQKGGIVPAGGGTPTADTTAIVITFTGAVSLTDADIVIGGAASRNTSQTLSNTGNAWEVPVTVSGSDNATVTISKDGVEDGTKTVTVYKAGVVPTANPVSGVTTYLGECKIEFSSTTGTASSGTYTMYRRGWINGEGPKLDVNGKYVWQPDEQGEYTWSSEAITLIPTTVYNGEGTDSFTRADAGTTMRALLQEELDAYMADLVDEGMTEAEAEALLIEMLCQQMGAATYTTLDSALDAYVIWFIEESFAPRSCAYTFINTNVLFLQENLPASVGTDELTGKTFTYPTDDPNLTRSYAFTNGTYTETQSWQQGSGGSSSTGSYSYNSTQKRVWIRPETVGGDDPDDWYGFFATNQTGDTNYFDTVADYQIAMTAQNFSVWYIPYQLDGLTLSWPQGK